jgi:hypothetical protein
MNRQAHTHDMHDGFERPRGRAQRWAVVIGRIVLLAATLALTSGVDLGAINAGTRKAQARTAPSTAHTAVAATQTGGRTTWR